MQSNHQIELFVSGRLCLFGEHSDWAGQMNRMNSQIAPGRAIVCGTEQGIYAQASKDDQLVVRTLTSDGETLDFTCSMETASLKEVAASGGFFSYIAGVATYMKLHYNVSGLNLYCYKMDLPIRKGLSSSAAICVLTARAFNLLYSLNLTKRGEMEAAYRGELLTPSRCGRMDQACAYGLVPVELVFDGDELSVEELTIGRTLHWVFADLQGAKDTITILSDLQVAFPFPRNAKDQQLHSLLGDFNNVRVQRVKAALAAGDAKQIGLLMKEAQANFDSIAAPFSPYELASPKLHAVLQDEHVQTLTYGGKGVGSHGDGCVQFIARDASCQQKLIAYLTELGMPAYALTLPGKERVRKAIIPLAGHGSRMYPVSKVIPKELMPIVTDAGYAQPALMVLLEELDEAGIEQIALIIKPGNRPVYENLFTPLIYDISEYPLPIQVMEDRLTRLREKIVFIEQPKALGFAHAVHQSKTFARGEPVLLCLGDHIYQSHITTSCTQQLVDTYADTGELTVGIGEVPLERVSHYGIVYGELYETDERNMMQMKLVVEKPSIEEALEYLTIYDPEAKRSILFNFFGQYLITNDVYEELEKMLDQAGMREVQFTEVLQRVIQKHGGSAVLIKGQHYDIGIPEAYRQTVAEFARKNQ